MRLTLVNIYPSNTIARYLLSSYALKAYLDSHFGEREELTVDVLNFSDRDDILKICEKIEGQKPDCVGYSCYIWNFQKVLDLIKELKGRDELISILGGPEISPERVRSLAEAGTGDYYVIGEGERVLLSLMQYIINKDTDPASKIPDGVAVNINGRYEYTPAASRITDLDEIPSVYLNGVLEERLYMGQQAFLETQRGCRFKCKYCVYHKNLSGVSCYSLDRVYAELDDLIIKKKILALRIFDSIFTHDLSRAKDIVRHLIGLKNLEGVRLPWIYWEFNYDMVDEEFLKLVSALKQKEKISNTDQIKPLNRPQFYREMVKDYVAINCVGVQSFSRQALAAVGRTPIDINRFKDFMNSVNENNIVLKTDMILGLPLETFDSYFKGLESFLHLLKDTDHILNIHRLQVLPGSDLEALCDKYAIMYSRDGSHTVSSTGSFSEEEMNHASRLNALLFRILNSPLRSAFFESKESSGKSFLGLMEDILAKISAFGEFKDIRLNTGEVDDLYWNDGAFKDIPSEWLVEVLSR